MSILLIHERADLTQFKNQLQEKLPHTKIELLNEVSAKDDVEFAISWKHPHGIFNQFKNLKVIASFGAGVDHIFEDQNLPNNITVTKIVDKQLTKDMCDFVLLQCLNFVRNIPFYHKMQSQKEWKAVKYKNPSEIQVGIMGLGTLGAAVAQNLAQNGFKVSGWSNSKKNIENVESYTKEELQIFLEKSEILICLLPLTGQTKGILNKDLFEKLPEQSCLINVARGAHLIEDDLKLALENGKIKTAFLDVFNEEPLPKESLLWQHESVHITPHVASVTNPASVVNQLADNYLRFKDNKELKFKVDLNKYY